MLGLCNYPNDVYPFGDEGMKLAWIEAVKEVDQEVRPTIGEKRQLQSAKLSDVWKCSMDAFDQAVNDMIEEGVRVLSHPYWIAGTQPFDDTEYDAGLVLSKRLQYTVAYAIFWHIPEVIDGLQ